MYPTTTVSQNSYISQQEFIQRVLLDPQWRNFQVDSRKVTLGNVFFALLGNTSDGHSFIQNAIDAGARAVVCNKAWYEQNSSLRISAKDSTFIAVENSLNCLQASAGAILSHSSAVKIGITGSNGKTSTKNMLVSVLSQSHKTHYSRENFNSVIGLPIEIARIPQNTEFAVFEMAMSERGEMNTLVHIIQPDHAILTNIGSAHIGNIGSIEGIAEEKFQIFARMTSENIAILPRDDNNTMNTMNKFPSQARILYYASKGDPSYALHEENEQGSRFSYKGDNYFLPFIGREQIHNACAVITLASALGISQEDVYAGLAKCRLPQARGEIIYGESILINDSYNANPESMISALNTAQVLANRESRPLVLVLGDMLELGSSSRAEHIRILQRALDSCPKSVLLVGDHFAEALACFWKTKNMHIHRHTNNTKEKSETQSFQTIDSLIDHVQNNSLLGNIFLVKASRGMELERVIPFIPGINEQYSDTKNSVQQRVKELHYA